MKPQDVERNDGTKNTNNSTDGRRTGNTNTNNAGSTPNTGSTASTGSTTNVGSTTTAGRTTHSESTNNRSTDYGRLHRSRNTDSEGNGGMLSNLGKGAGVLGVLGALAGGALLFRGIKGQWPFSGSTISAPKIVDLSTKQTIQKPREELYAYWRNLENLPNFMSHLEEVRELDDKRSTWTAKIPGGLGTVEWDAEIVRERTNHLIAWRSLGDAEIENSGEVRFESAPGGRGTIVETTISYRPPAGELGSYAAKLFNPAFEKTVKKDLEEFKKFMEKGGKAKRKSTPSNRA